MKIMRDMKGQLLNSKAVPFLKVGLRRDEGHSTLHPGGKTHIGPISKIHSETILCFTQQKERESSWNYLGPRRELRSFSMLC